MEKPAIITFVASCLLTQQTKFHLVIESPTLRTRSHHSLEIGQIWRRNFEVKSLKSLDPDWLRIVLDIDLPEQLSDLSYLHLFVSLKLHFCFNLFEFLLKEVLNPLSSDCPVQVLLNACLQQRLSSLFTRQREWGNLLLFCLLHQNRN